LLRALLTISPSMEKPSEVHPRTWPAVSNSLRLPMMPCEVLHAVDVSDSHAVRSHDVCAKRTAPVYPPTPRPCPTTVKLDDPVPARLDLTTALIDLLSVDSPTDKLPDRVPTVTNRCRLPLIPCAILHSKPVSDAHLVRSHAVTPSLTVDVEAAGPNPSPCNVTLADPVVATFVRPKELLAPKSNEKPYVLLPVFSDVTETWRLPITPGPVWHRIDVSDSHAVLSHTVRPRRDPTE
jgi:hypothetical protein